MKRHGSSFAGEYEESDAKRASRASAASELDATLAAIQALPLQSQIEVLSALDRDDLAGFCSASKGFRAWCSYPAFDDFWRARIEQCKSPTDFQRLMRKGTPSSWFSAWLRSCARHNTIEFSARSPQELVDAIAQLPAAGVIFALPRTLDAQTKSLLDSSLQTARPCEQLYVFYDNRLQRWRQTRLPTFRCPPTVKEPAFPRAFSNIEKLFDLHPGYFRFGTAYRYSEDWSGFRGTSYA